MERSTDDMIKFEYFRHDGARFRRPAGFGPVREIMTPEGWEKYAGLGLDEALFGTRIEREEAENLE